jgi:hypothetical protein
MAIFLLLDWPPVQPSVTVGGQDTGHEHQERPSWQVASRLSGSPEQALAVQLWFPWGPAQAWDGGGAQVPYELLGGMNERSQEERKG